jgi:ubiquinol-cytochrome c reductase subunit 6
MAIWDMVSDLIEAATPWGTAHADAPVAPAEQHKDEDAAAEPAAKANDDGDSSDAAAAKDDDEEKAAEEEEEEAPSEEEEEGEEEEEEEEEEDEDEDDDEPKDPKEELEEQCAQTKCHSYKHHYDECAARVTGAIDAGEKPDEDCVEEFFHLTHCVTACAAPKLWAKLK